MVTGLLRLGVFSLLLMLPLVSKAGIIIGSWNIEHLGWAHDAKRVDMLAHIAQSMDLIAIQEVMSVEAVEDLVDELESITGDSWDALTSHSVGRGSRYREMYAYVWREASVAYAGGAVLFLDSRDVFAREPFLAKFKSRVTGQEMAIANIHVLYGDGVGDRLPEVAALSDIWQWMGEVFPGVPRLIAGDFNLSPHHPGWEELREAGAAPTIQHGATTLSTHNGRYANLYDNVWLLPGALDVTQTGIIDFPDLLGIDHEFARDVVSDHAPIFIALSGADLIMSPFQGTMSDPGMQAANDPDNGCVDLNNSSLEILDTLPHIGPSRAQDIIEGRPWNDASSLVRLSGIGLVRAADIEQSELLCGG